MNKFASYIRVSTNQQADSKLGIEAQQRLNRNYIDSVNGKLVKEAIEVETGTNKLRISIKNNLNLQTLLKKRPILRELIEFCKSEGLTLIIKDLSRLGRNQLLISYLMQAGINFICADSPNDSPFILQIKAALAEEEARMISRRTIEALQSKKAKGEKLGTPKPENLELGRKIQAQRKKQEAIENYSKITPVIKTLRAENKSYSTIANELNKFGLKTIEGKIFHSITVRRILAREIESNK
jgi:DNA invertase Pin-like site-specific DNA recombinase